MHTHADDTAHAHDHSTDDNAADPNYFEAAAWDGRYAGADSVWSGNANPQLIAEATKLQPGTALDVGCGEGGDVIWLAQQGWHVTGADFSATGLTRAAEHAQGAGIADRTDWWQVDAREFDAAGRSYDLVTSHFLHLPDGRMVDAVASFAAAVAPGGHLLIVGHSPSAHFTELTKSKRDAMFLAEDLLPGLPEDFEAIVVEQRPRRVTRDGVTVDIDDSTFLARRRA